MNKFVKVFSVIDEKTIGKNGRATIRQARFCFFEVHNVITSVSVQKVMGMDFLHCKARKIYKKREIFSKLALLFISFFEKHLYFFEKICYYISWLEI